ncbi:MAG: protein kinase [Planctomycetaceae bacterium]|nr:protein kinase [Planctomycetaceae bacterium]
MTSFLEGKLSRAHQAEFESHLTQCEDCRRRLDTTVASPQEWTEVRRSLAAEQSSDPFEQRDTADSAEADQLLWCRRLLSPTDDPHMLGRIAGYEIAGLLGRGGMGIVFKGFDSALNRYVAIKMMAPQYSASGVARQRFFREAQAAAGVVHEHVIAIHCVAMWQEHPYLVMPYVQGKSLQKRLDENGPLQLREILRIGMQVASGLAAAHAQGLIHRDVKPANILMESGVDRVYLTDFGLARTVDDIRLTKTDTLVGTPQYMSPEQTNDESLDYRSDLFSLGSVLYEACTGRPAFQAATSYGVIRRINERQPVPIQDLNPDIPDWLVGIVARLMEKDPRRRFQTAAEVETLLRDCLSHVEQPRLTPLPIALSRRPNRTFVTLRRFFMTAVFLAVVVGASSLLMTGGGGNNSPLPADKTGGKPSQTKYASAQEALQAGAMLVNAGKAKESREPLEAALKLAKDDEEMMLRVYQTLLSAYRELPEFEPFQKAAEYIIERHPQDAGRSLTRRSYLAFAFNRGQMENLVKRYENVLKKDPDNRMALYLLSEIYSSGAGIPRDVANASRAVELLERLDKVNARLNRSSGPPTSEMSAADRARISLQKGRLAQQYMRAKEYLKAAELYEEIAPLDPATHAWNLKEAATAYLNLKDHDNALRLALAAEEAPAEARNDQLTYFCERQLGDTFVTLGKPGKAIPHYETALKKTTIPGYVDSTTAALQQAIRQRDQ